MIKRLVARLEKLGSRSSLFVRLYIRPYVAVVQNEIALAGITAADRVLNVGCGAIPFTAILIARLAGAEVIALDRDPEAARLAAACVARLGLADRIQVVHQDGSRPLPVAADVAVVALQAEPKAAILARLCDGPQPIQRIVVRTPSERYYHHYDPLPPRCPVAAVAPQSMRTFDRSVLITDGIA